MTKNYFSIVERKALGKFKTQVIDNLKEEILDLKIFGSKARGDFRKSSDIDVLVLIKNQNLKTNEIIFNIASRILIKYGVDLSIKIFSQEEFKKGLDLQAPFYLKVNKEAVKI